MTHAAISYPEIMRIIYSNRKALSETGADAGIKERLGVGGVQDEERGARANFFPTHLACACSR